MYPWIIYPWAHSPNKSISIIIQVFPHWYVKFIVIPTIHKLFKDMDFGILTISNSIKAIRHSEDKYADTGTNCSGDMTITS